MTPAQRKSYQKIYKRTRTAMLKRARLCVDCGEVPPNATHVLCESCLEERRIAWRNRHDGKCLCEACRTRRNGQE